MYNNEVTYDKKWETPENRAALKKLDDKFFDRSYASPSCPTAWAPEVLELLELLDKELGIERNTSTIRAYYVQGKPLEWFITGPFKGAFNTFVDQFLKPTPEWRKDKPYTVTQKLQRVASSFLHSIKYGIRASKILYVNPIINKILKPKLRLSQVKEKYGELRIYFDAPPAFEEWVEQEISKTIIKLAMKGAYYPLESLYGYAVSYNVEDKYNPDSVEIEKGTYSSGEEYVSVKKTTMRKLMKEMGVNMEDIKLKYLERKEREKNQP